MSCGFSDVQKDDIGYMCSICGAKFDEYWMRRAIAGSGIKALHNINPKLMKDYNAALELLPSKHV